MGHLGATIFAGLLFLFAAFYGGLLPASFANVSPETGSVKHAQETILVKQGVSQDGFLAVNRIPSAPQVPPSVKSLNHSRTLRAFIGPDRAGISSLYVESTRPHEYYTVTGAFMIVPEYALLAWTGETALVFYGTSSDGQLMRYVVDLNLLTISGAPTDTLPPVLPLGVRSSIIVP